MNFLIPFSDVSKVPSGWLDSMMPVKSRQRILVRIFLAVSLFLFCQAIFAAESANPVEPNISRLEMKFFQHDYPKDTMDTRLERLEKMVFGEVKAGSNYERLSNLLSCVPNLSNQISDGKEAKQNEASLGSAKDSVSQDSPASIPQGTPRRDYVSPEGSKYPAVTAIETRVFGKDFAGEPVNKRLDRLEAKVFGKPSGIVDLSERVDRIKQHTGVDIARQAPAGSDWADEYEDDVGYYT
ncbi:MAG: hypothetical protein HY711_08265, partial [Candidatus Melainabacteria bacterium]|nr:hypothetical protein [Candidatus Melainabacteria bacterium]